MAETVLVIEYEPRYLDRLRKAFASTPVELAFARDGGESLAALESSRPTAIILSWILPKTNVTELIAAIHSTEPRIPILLTVSGYSGRDPRADARRVGADDLLAKPFTDADVLARVGALIGRDLGTPAPAEPSQGTHPAHPHAAASAEGGKVDSSEIFGELVDEQSTAEKSREGKSEDLDALLDQTLLSLKKKKKSGGAKAAPMEELDRLVEDTLSGLRRKPVQQPAPPGASASRPEPEPEPFLESEDPAPPLLEGDETQTARPGARFGQFVLRDRIATGGMAEVWQAQMQGVEGFEKLVAIKRILPHLAADQDFVDMFIDEAKIAARLNHPNIIHIYDLGKAANTYYIAMELVDGHDLKSILRQAKERGYPMDIPLAMFVASRVAAALEYAHRKEPGLVHRDVSPQNVLISWDGDIKLCDFGIAKATSKVSHTQSGALKGKLQYMSPEQASGRPIDNRSDIFSLGVVLYEMLAGQKLFSGDSEISVLEQVRDPRVTAPSLVNDEVPPEIDRIVLKALAREPENRYATAAEMVKDLEHVLYGFKPAPSVADLAVWMHRLWAAEPEPIRREPDPVAATAPAEKGVITLVAPVPAAEPEEAPEAVAPPPPPRRREPAAAPPEPAAVASPFTGAHEPAPKSRAPIWIALGLLVLAGAGFGAWQFVSRESAPPAADQTAAAMTPPPAAAPARPVTTETIAAETTGTVLPLDEFPQAELAPPISPEEVDEEVRRRLDAERQRLERLRAEQLARAQQQADAAAAARARREENPPARTTTVAAAEPAEPSAVPTQSTPAETETVAETVTAAAEPVRQAPAYRAGDLVPTGTPGLVEPTLVSLKKVSYPAMARSRKVQGIVVLRALVSETGSVLEVEILRSVSPDFGISDAARDAVRGGRFRPATFEGAPVRAWKILTVPFTL